MNDPRQEYDWYPDKDLRAELDRLGATEARMSIMRGAKMVPGFVKELEKEIETYTKMYRMIPVGVPDVKERLAGIQAAEYALSNFLEGILKVDEQEKLALSESKQIRDVILKRNKERKEVLSHFDRKE